MIKPLGYQKLYARHASYGMTRMNGRRPWERDNVPTTSSITPSYGYRVARSLVLVRLGGVRREQEGHETVCSRHDAAQPIDGVTRLSQPRVTTTRGEVGGDQSKRKAQGPIPIQK